jgi:cytochrome P450
MWLLPSEREALYNINMLKEKLLPIIHNRKKMFKEGKLPKSGDLLTTLVQTQDLYDSDEIILDELFAFFFAGS